MSYRLECSFQIKALTEMDEASHGCQQEDKSKLFPLCKKGSVHEPK